MERLTSKISCHDISTCKNGILQIAVFHIRSITELKVSIFLVALFQRKISTKDEKLLLGLSVSTVLAFQYINITDIPAASYPHNRFKANFPGEVPPDRPFKLSDSTVSEALNSGKW
jgi:hypothetical protein